MISKLQDYEAADKFRISAKLNELIDWANKMDTEWFDFKERNIKIRKEFGDQLKAIRRMK